ncbi:MAG: hypothetical protein ABIN94_14435 [Ferruginibacter sp.]
MMKFWIIAASFFWLPASIFGQKINGQWRGYFNSSGDIVLTGGENTEYVLEIEINGSQISGFSYSYFQNRKYYVICSLTGSYYKSTKSMKITETARVKGVMPPDWSDCLQTHILTYQKQGEAEELTGRWVTAPGQVGECGKGSTTLTRRTVSKNLSSYNKSKSGTPFSSQKPIAKAPVQAQKNGLKPAPPIAKAEQVKPKESVVIPPVSKVSPVERDAPEISLPQLKKQVVPILPPDFSFEKRSSDIIKTIEIEHARFKVDLYDNGEIDGDTISLFYNGKLLLSHKRLGDKPITLMLEANTGIETNELTMYAENLGLYPPNTALMVVTDGDKRYEVRIASDLKKSGTIRFVKSPSQNPTSAKTVD